MTEKEIKESTKTACDALFPVQEHWQDKVDTLTESQDDDDGLANAEAKLDEVTEILQAIDDLTN